jgi:hypothetical protein
VDDTGARRKANNGFCTQIGNAHFTAFATTTSKSRLNFLSPASLTTPISSGTNHGAAAAGAVARFELVRLLTTGSPSLFGQAGQHRGQRLRERHPLSRPQGAKSQAASACGQELVLHSHVLDFQCERWPAISVATHANTFLGLAKTRKLGISSHLHPAEVALWR